MGLFFCKKEELEIANKKIEELQKGNESLSSENGELKKKLENKSEVLNEIKRETARLNNEKISLESKKEELEKECSDLESKIALKREEYVELEDKVLLQSFGLYEPQYDFASSSLYKNKLTSIRTNQSEMIKNGSAATCAKKWIIEGSASKGQKFTDDNIKQILKTFNNECENAILKVKFNNIDSVKKRITTSFNSLNKLNMTNRVSISKEFLDLKYDELYLAYEYAKKVQEEKEELRIQRELHKEELRVAKELEEKRAEIEKEQHHYSNILKRILEQINIEKNDERKQLLFEKKEKIVNNLVELDQALKDVDYREANQRAGYVYIISNIGAFGKDIYKIGMTRRLDPQDRIDELGSASVPFRFDVHAFIFSDDAPKLENALHKAFENNRVNMMNNRKEFFNITLEEIEKVVKENYDKIVNFKHEPDAEQYRETLIKLGKSLPVFDEDTEK